MRATRLVFPRLPGSLRSRNSLHATVFSQHSSSTILRRRVLPPAMGWAMHCACCNCSQPVWVMHACATFVGHSRSPSETDRFRIGWRTVTRYLQQLPVGYFRPRARKRHHSKGSTWARLGGMAFGISIKATDHSGAPVRELWRQFGKFEAAPSMVGLNYPPHLNFGRVRHHSRAATTSCSEIGLPQLRLYQTTVQPDCPVRHAATDFLGGTR
jgi:hypothetical protein